MTVLTFLAAGRPRIGPAQAVVSAIIGLPESAANVERQRLPPLQTRRAPSTSADNKMSETPKKGGAANKNQQSELRKLKAENRHLQKQLADKNADAMDVDDAHATTPAPDGNDSVKERIAQLQEQRAVLANDKFATAWVQQIDVQLAELRAQKRANQPLHIQRRDADAKVKKLQRAEEQTESDIAKAEVELQKMRDKKASIATDLAAANAHVRELAALTMDLPLAPDDVLEGMPWYKDLDLQNGAVAEKLASLKALFQDVKQEAERAKEQAKQARTHVPTAHLPDMEDAEAQLEADFSEAMAAAKVDAGGAGDNGNPVDSTEVFREVCRRRRSRKGAVGDGNRDRSDRSRSPVPSVLAPTA